MSLQNFIPEVWSDLILAQQEKSLVFGKLCNRSYEGEISAFGDTVHINDIGPVTIAPYVKNKTVIEPEQLDDNNRQLIIDQTGYFAFGVDDIDKAQTKPKVMGQATRQASYGLADYVDQYLSGFHTEAGIVNEMGATGNPLAIDRDNIYKYISLISQKMDDVNVPSGGRWLVAPPWFMHILRLAQIGVVIDGGRQIEGLFNIYVSNNLRVVNTQHKMIAGNMDTIAFAQQISSIEAYRPEKAFSDAVKGLVLFGAKVYRPENLACLTAVNAESDLYVKPAPETEE
jgi:hypothetical protein